MNKFIGSHLICMCVNGWKYEFYVKNENTIDSRIYSVMAEEEWRKKQEVISGVVEDGGHVDMSWFQKPAIDKVGSLFNINVRK